MCWMVSTNSMPRACPLIAANATAAAANAAAAQMT
jgi:hypothetical protein